MNSVIKDITYLTPEAQTACRLFMDECKNHGIDVFITETYRSQSRQDYLYSLGRTREGNKVTWTRSSRHTSRRAWDIACSPPQNLYDAGILKKCGEVAKTLGITWGGEWSTPDYPHFEVKENWTMPKGDVNMEELRTLEKKVEYIDESLTNLYSIVQRLADKDKVYTKLSDIPEWAHSDIAELIQSGALKGDESGSINLTDEMLRTLIIIKRMFE